MLNKILTFILVSSQDPEKLSKTVVFFLLACIPHIINAIGITCALSIFCASTTQSDLEGMVKLIGTIILLVFTLFSHIGLLWAMFRKVKLTLGGQNKALNQLD